MADYILIKGTNIFFIIQQSDKNIFSQNMPDLLAFIKMMIIL